MLTSTRSSLLPALERCAAVADPKSPAPILACCLIDNATVSATDLYRSVSCDTNATGTLRCCVNAKDLLARVKAMPDGEIGLGLKKDALVVTGVGKRKFTLQTASADEFPKLPQCGDVPELPFAAGDFAKLVTSVAYAISTDETRAHVNSLCLSGDGSRVAATDGHRLATMATDATDTGSNPVLVPLKAVKDLVRLGAGKVSIRLCGPNLFAVADGVTYAVRLVDAQFPPVSQVIPKSSPHTVNLPRQAMRDAISAVSLAAAERTGGVVFTFAPGLLTVSAESPDGGDATDEVPCDHIGETCRIGFAARYWLEALDALDDDEVSVGFGAELDPATLRGSGDGVAVVMPMRLTA
jgi:DNA polymerase-3 subunit beta